MLSVRFKIAAVTITAILTSLLAFIIVGVYTLGGESDRNSVEKMNLLSKNAQGKVDGHLNGLKHSVDLMTHFAGNSLEKMNLKECGVTAASVKTGRTPEQVRMLDDLMKKHCEEVQKAFGSIAEYTDGITSYYYYINPDLCSSELGFFYSKIGKTSFEKNQAILLFRPDPFDKESSAWYFEPVTKGKACWVGPYRAPLLGKLQTFSYVTPIYHYGVLIGVLGMDTLFYNITVPVRAVRVYDSGFAFLLDSDGHIVYHPVIAMGKTLNEVSRGLSPEMFQGLDNGSELIRYDVDGELRQLSFTTMSNGLKLAVSAPVKEIFSSWRQMTRFILMAAVAILILFTIATLFVVEAVTKPLLQLASASKKLAAGDFDVKLDYTGDDEVGILTQTFRQMRDRLKLYIGDLNSRAYSDALTGIRNKGAFDIYSERLNNKIHLHDTNDRPEFAIVMFDCNWLKNINDAYGHERGDVYLKTASKSICRIFAHSPVFRLGGDEFAVLLQGDDYMNRESLLQRFDSTADEVNAEVSNPWEKISMARGIAVFLPDTDVEVGQVLRRADEQMYENKREMKVSAVPPVPAY